MIYFTADLHLGHEAIIEYCNRNKFKNVTVMDKKLIQWFNWAVSPDDTVYIIGDLSIKTPTHKMALANQIHSMNGEKHLILGNHDMMKPFDYIEMGFTSVHTSLKVEEFILNHDPSAACIIKNQVWLCGHVHDLFKHQRNVVNVGVDVWNYAPVSIADVRKYIRDNKVQR